MSNIPWRLVVIVLSLAALPSMVRADEVEDEKLFQKVMNRLMKCDLFVKEYPSKFAYPPKSFIKPKSVKEMNAYASSHKAHGAELDGPSKKIRPVVMITQGFMDKVIKGDENSLAVIMGHELAHLTKDHVGGRKGDTGLLVLSFGRDQEIEADVDGLRYAIAAGYPYKKGVATAFREIRANTNYSSFEGLNSSHPSWEERLIFLDREQSKLWSAMSAFRNGYVFLEAEQYQSAQQCFKAVTAEFPDCAEAWANLGYARLMQYSDGLDSDDLKRFDIGQIVTGGFYARPDSLESKVRGIDEKAWKDAVGALTKAVAVNGSMVLPRASLGVAYLVHPDGRDVKKARKYFSEATEYLSKDPSLKSNPHAVASMLINSGVADLAAGDTKEAEKKFSEADRVVGNRTMDTALLYNQALLLATSKDLEDKTRACRMFEQYLDRSPMNSSWWQLAYTRYTKLCKESEVKARTRTSFIRKARPQDFRVVVSVSVDKHAITLAEPTDKAVEHLGKEAGEALPLYPDSKLVRWRFPERGVDLLAKDKVIAIFLTNPKAPAVTLQQVGISGDAEQLKVGMTEAQAKDLLKDQRIDRGLRTIADSKIGYHFYPALGLAIRYENSRVEEIAIAQIPRREMQFDDD